LDLIAPLVESDGHTAILVIVDRLTKHAQFIPTHFDLNTEGFTHFFIKHVACRSGLPDLIIADRDGRWCVGFWQQVCLQMRVRMALLSAWHPQHDGQTEIVKCRLEVMLRAYVAEDHSSWARWLHMLELAYNSALHQSTDNIPYRLLYGFVPKNYLNYLAPSEDRRGLSRSNPPKVECFIAQMRAHQEAARTAVARAQVKQAEAYNAGRRPVEFDVGMWVLVNPHSLKWIESKGKSVKLVQRWIGPFEVMECVGPNTYRLRMSERYTDVPVFNIEHLQPYWKSPPEFGDRAKLPLMRLEMYEVDDVEDVEDVVNHRYNKSKRGWYFRVRFKGLPAEEDVWLPAPRLKNAGEILRQYRTKNQI
jgi:hypothetical protein